MAQTITVDDADPLAAEHQVETRPVHATTAAGGQHPFAREFAIAEHQVQPPAGRTQAPQSAEHLIVHGCHLSGFEPVFEQIAQDHQACRWAGGQLVEELRKGVDAAIQMDVADNVEDGHGRCRMSTIVIHGGRLYAGPPAQPDASIGLTVHRRMLLPMRVALLIAYDGTDFAGWWRQPGQRTVAGVFDEAFARLGEATAQVVGASRTDAGVHAQGQVAHVTTARAWKNDELCRALATHLPADVACRAVAQVPDDWDACHAAVAKTYHYTIDHGAVPDPFLARFAWRPPFALDRHRLEEAAQGIAGERDWSGFSKRGETRHLDGDLVRRIDQVAWSTIDGRLTCEVTGGGFAYRLVRSLVGAMIAVANGTCTRADLDASLAGRESPAGRQLAPARGLCLMRVAYASRIFA